MVSTGMLCLGKILHKYPDVWVEMSNGTEYGIARWEKCEWDLSFRWEREWECSRWNGRDLVRKSVGVHLYFKYYSL